MQKFWGRKSEIQNIEKKIKCFVETDSGLETNYLGYWGISGIGKSELIKKALKSESIIDLDFLPIISIDCSVVGRDVIRLYDQIVMKVEEAVGITAFENYKKYKENNKSIVKDMFQNFSKVVIPDIVETALVTVLGPIGQGLIPKVASHISATGLEMINNAKCDRKTLEEILLEILIKDFKTITEHKMIIIIDSLEYMENDQHELPLTFGGKNGLLSGVSNVLWILLGQNKNAYLEELRPLETEEYVEEFRNLIKKNDIEVQLEKVINISKGIPYILQLLYKALEDSMDELIFEESYWDETWNPIFTRFFMNYDNQTLRIIGILSVIRNWDDKFVNNLLSYLRFHDLLKWNIEKDDFKIYQTLKGLPFIKYNELYFSFNDNVIRYYRRIFSDDNKMEIYRFATKYILQKYKQNSITEEVNLYLLTWIRDVKSIPNYELEKREMISAIYLMLNEFLSYENIYEWENVVYEVISIAISLNKPELNNKIITYLLYYAYTVADTEKIRFCYWLQSKVAENEGDDLGKKIKLLKSQCVLVRTKSVARRSKLPFGIKYSIEYSRKELCEDIVERCKKLKNSCKKIDYMIDCLAEYEYVYPRNVLQLETFLKELINAMKELNIIENVTLENIIRYIYFFESLNLVLYHNKDMMKKELNPFFENFVGLEKFVPESIKGEYYYQVAFYQFNRDIESYKNFILAKKYSINNCYHKMWTERACANYCIQQRELQYEEEEILYSSLEYILNHGAELSEWNFIGYLRVYVGLRIVNRMYNGIEELIEYITKKDFLMGCSVRDVDGYCLNKYSLKIIEYAIYEMKNYTLALKWINHGICGSQIKDKEYFRLKIVVLKYKIFVQNYVEDEMVPDSINELKSILYTAEVVLGKNDPDILLTRKWLQTLK